MEDIKFEKVPSGIFDKVKSNKEQFVEKFIDDLEKLFPDTVKDGRVDFQALLERFGEYQDTYERYEMTWVGKNKARQEAFEDIVGRTLKYVEEDSKNPETTENLYIEGDNLEVLKLLRNSYYGKINVIYIDPPYNRKKGNDLVYRDDFTLTKEEYDKLKGDIDEYGERLIKNSSSSGRYHSNWLNMIYPRLYVAKDLIATDGVIFISIDDNEVHNMRKICDEIFGEENFLASFIRKGIGGRQDSKHYAEIHEYIICYAKEISKFTSGKKIVKGGSYPFFDSSKNKRYKTQLLRKWGENSRREDRPNLFYPIKDPDGNDFYPMLPNKTEGCWRWGKEKMFKEIEKGNVEFKKRNNEWVAYEKLYEPSEGNFRTKLYTTLIEDIENSSGAPALKDLFNQKIFSYPKPYDLIKKIINRSSFDKNITVLDFFSGSATTAHAVMDLNAEDGGNRKFIMVQLPEPTDEKSVAYKEGYKNICEIGKERIRRAGDKILEENKDKEGIENLDVGFKVFRVDDTNFRRIKEVEAEDLETRYKSLTPKEEKDFNPHFTDIDVVYELMLRRQDIELTEEVKKLDYIGDRTYIIGNTMLVCLEEDINKEIIEKIGTIDADLSWIVLRDSAFDDDCDLKINTANKLRSIIKSSRNKNQKIYWI